MTEPPKIYDPQYYQRMADVESQHWWARGMRILTRNFLTRIPCSGWLLDAGCGTGGQLRDLPGDWADRGIGIELSADALRYCREKGSSRLSQASAGALPFWDSTFACITCNQVVQHLTLADLHSTIHEFFRVLKPAGYLLVCSNSRIGWIDDPESTPPDYRRFLLKELEDHLTEAGFRIVTSSYINVLPSLPMLLRPPRKEGYTGMKIHNLPPRLSWLNSLMVRYMRLEARLVQWNIRFPYGQSTFVIVQRPS